MLVTCVLHTIYSNAGSICVLGAVLTVMPGLKLQDLLVAICAGQPPRGEDEREQKYSALWSAIFPQFTAGINFDLQQRYRKLVQDHVNLSTTSAGRSSTTACSSVHSAPGSAHHDKGCTCSCLSVSKGVFLLTDLLQVAFILHFSASACLTINQCS